MDEVNNHKLQTSEFSVGQRAFINKIHGNNGSAKKQHFEGRVVTILSKTQFRTGNRYFVCLAVDERVTAHFPESDIQLLGSQKLCDTDSIRLGANVASEVGGFDESKIPLPDEKSLLWSAYMVLDHGTQEERLDLLNTLTRYFEKHGRQ
ncbi:TPA: hypothetical protein PMC35_003267 [Vibrio cholerae]|nr:hypothetical protein [Vibrio cholerae]